MGQIILAAATSYPDLGHPRLEYARELVRRARAAGLEVVLGDRSPSDDVRHELWKLGARVIDPQSPGLGGQYKDAVSHALDLVPNPLVVVVTAEKYDIVRSIPQIVASIDDGGAVLSWPSRSRPVMEATYPNFQVTTELDWMQDSIGGSILCRPFDFGLFVAAFKAGPFADLVLGSPDASYGVLWRALVQAHVRGWSIDTPVIEFRYPEQQRAEEERMAEETFRKKRTDQAMDCFRIVMEELRPIPSAVAI